MVGWAMGELMTAELVLAALNMALQQRRPMKSFITATKGVNLGKV